MNEADLIRIIKQVVREELAPILMGKVVSNEDQNRSTIKRFDSDGPIPRARNIQPFGVSSRAPKGTQALITPIDGNVTHLILTGHFDESRPTTRDGETIIYDAFGHIVYLSTNKMQFGSKASDENMVLGKVLKKCLGDILTALQAETHMSGIPGFPTSVPVNAPDYAAIKATPVDDSAVLSDIAFTEKG